MNRLSLPAVTLCCVDTTARLPWSIKAMQHCMAQIDFGDVILCTDRATLADTDLPAGIRWVEIAALRSIEAYSDFMLRGLCGLFSSSHVLVVQWDGYVLNPQKWRPEFLAYDYIGAPWTHESEPFNVGNGGFSLRSRKLLDSWRALELPGGHPEDLLIGKTYRAQLQAQGLSFAPTELAWDFSVEDGSLDREPFGFHGPFHFPSVLPAAELVEFLDSLNGRAVSAWFLGSLLRELVRCHRAGRLPAEVHGAIDAMLGRLLDALQGDASLQPPATSLCKSLIRYGYVRAAARLLHQRRQAAASVWPDARLWLRCQWRRASLGRRDSLG